LNRQAGSGHSMGFAILKRVRSNIRYFRTPPEVYEFVWRFDAGISVLPFEFEFGDEIP